MAPDRAAIRERLRRFDFRSLFVEELGWDIHRARHEVSVAGRSYEMEGVAEKDGMAVYLCQAPDGLPDAATRRRIEREVNKLTHEKLIVFTDAARTAQVWQWVKEEPGRPAAFRELAFQAGLKEELLVQKLDAIAFDIQEAERITSVAQVAARVGASFDVDKVTRRFYDRFKTEHQGFLGFITGIETVADREWYASLMLNRLMFIYFFQRQGFLDGDSSYLRNRLDLVKRQRGTGQFHTFYRYFLKRLFHEGLGQPTGQRNPALEPLLGRVPYLNGGLFDEHHLERSYPDVDIPDQAFEKVFDFFDAYDWHLDDRPLGTDREINPDVLGYIFEKYVNQKQMGAYYTKEDITEYIAKNTIIPFLFDAAEKKCAIAFRPDGAVWRLLRDDPDRYIYEAVRKGVDLPLPPDIEVGVADVSKRGGWNRPAAEGYALPTETWREHVARRQRCREIRARLGAGEVHSIDELVTLNLDLRRFAQDVVERAEGPELVRAFWHALAGRVPERSNERWEQGISVLDPTCGSGAFLFAALNVLLPLYEACLQRMQQLTNEADLADPQHGPSRYPDFRRTLARMAEHANPRYFILKSVILENLYGVDIMEEAVEICKLRLFLKLVAQLDSADQIEPLPDIDFNIRAGNTLVGFATREQVRQALTVGSSGQMKLVSSAEDEALRRIDELAELADRAFKQFRLQQTQFGGVVTAADKAELRSRLESLDAELDQLLARQYDIQPSRVADFNRWRKSHRPFHWFVEFYGIMAAGGFDVIIGNPPYVELKDLTGYVPLGYFCESAGNLYALVLERCSGLAKGEGQQGFIVPVSSVSTDRYAPLQSLLMRRRLAYSSFDDRPSRLFDGLEHIRLTIHLLGQPNTVPNLHPTRYYKWNAAERPVLFNTLSYARGQSTLVTGSIPKLSSPVEAGIIERLQAQGCRLSTFYSPTGRFPVFYSRKVGYFLQVLDFEPLVLDGKGERRPPSEFKRLLFSDAFTAKAALCCLNANLFYWFVTVFSDCRHVNRREVDQFPMDIDRLLRTREVRELVHLSDQLMMELRTSSEHRVMRFKHDVLTVQHIFVRQSKPIIDQIDMVLAKHYGFTNEELDFIINYDIKYRMGVGTDTAEDE